LPVRLHAQAREVAARAGKAGNQPLGDRIGCGRGHDGDGAGRALGRSGRQSGIRDDDIHIQADQLRCKLRKSLVPSR
jgi:hypothetical protein